MRISKIIFWTLWRIWFYIIMTLLILVLFPLLFVTTLKENWYGYFFKLAKIWAKSILFTMGFWYKVDKSQELDFNKSYMLVANHSSMMDIMLMLAVIENPFVFVGKKELGKIPLFGFFYKRTCILVDRSSTKSRREVFALAQERINQGLSICIFPEGGVPENNIFLDNFKEGAFRLAIEHQIPIVPITFGDNKRLFSFHFFSGRPGLMRVKIHSAVDTTERKLLAKKDIRDEVRNIILKQLTEFNQI